MTTLSISKFAASLFAALLTVSSLAPAMHAQTQDKRAIANVPFAFEVGAAHFEPGIYTVSQPRASILAVTNFKDSGNTMTRTETDYKPATRGKLVFRKVGDRYFLNQVWTAGSTQHTQCVLSSAEMRARKAVLALNQAPAPSTDAAVEVAAR